MGVDDEVLAVSAAWDDALVSNDAEAVGAFMADGWAYVGPDGPVPRVDLLGWIASGRLAHHTMETVGTPRIVAAGDCVVVTARRRSTGSWEGAEYATDEWISEVFVRAAGRWTCLLSHKCVAA
jgi:ketosteroid isomerase-like protein